jgi:PASTA domain
MRKLVVLFGMLAFGLSATPAFGQATRTWVSATGNDVDPCSFTAPCRTFAGAYGKTFIGGEINAMTDGGFGTLSIGHSITIDGNGHHASILSSGTTGVNINIPTNPDDPNRRVVLRNLSVNGAGANITVGTNTGLHGVRVMGNGAETVEIENVRIFGFTQNGITVAPGAGSPSVLNMSLDNVFVADNFGNAFDLRVPDTSHSVNALVKNSAFKHSTGTTGTAGETGIGIAADTGTHVWLTGNAIFDNLVGLRTFARQGAPGVIDSFCDNQIVGNLDNGTAPNELCPKPVTPAPEIIRETVPGPPQCIVPRLKGLPLAFAKRLLNAAHCALGKVTRKKATRRSQVGKVLSQKTRAGAALPQGTKVAVTVGRR